MSIGETSEAQANINFVNGYTQSWLQSFKRNFITRYAFFCLCLL